MSDLYVYAYKPATHLCAEGEDAADFLQSQFSNDLRAFGAGRCTYGLWLDAKGKVQADAQILQEGAESFRIISEDSGEDALRAHLERHLVADDVAIEPSASYREAFALIGEQGSTVLEALGITVPEPGQYSRGEGVFAFPGKRSRQVSYELLLESASASGEALRVMESLGGQSVSADWIEQARMSSGNPRVPIELGPEDLPGEASLVGHAVSLHKGCFLGQEVVARMHNVGRPRRGLFLLRGDGSAPGLPAEVHRAMPEAVGRSVGQLRSAVPVENGWQGVAMLKLQAVEAASVLSVCEHPILSVEPLRGGEA